MGANLTAEQVENLKSGRAVYNDHEFYAWHGPNYVEHAEGCASKAIWGARRDAEGKKTSCFSEMSGVKVDMPASAVDDIMKKCGATELYQKFMAEVYTTLESSTTLQWRSALLKTRQRFVPHFFAVGIDVWACGSCDNDINEYWILFVDRAVAPPNVRESIQWSYLLWWSNQEACDAHGCSVESSEAALLSADYCKVSV